MPPKLKATSANSGARKAAILVLAIGEDRAGDIFSAMDDYEIRDLSREMASLGKLSSEEVENTLNEFTDMLAGGGGGLAGGWSTTERFLKSFMKEDRVKELMEEMRGPAGRNVWEKLDNVSEDILAGYIQNEYPQTIAVVISKLKPAHAARVFNMLPEKIANEVMGRMLLMDNVSREVIESVEDSLRGEFMRNLADSTKRDSHEMMADIFNNFDRSAEEKFMKSLEDSNPDDAEKIRALMFTFEDILKTNDAGMQTILREVDKDTLSLALKGASDQMKSFVLQNMSERAAKILNEDMQAMGPVRVKDVDEAQLKVVQVAKNLADQERIVLADGEDEEEFIQ